MHHKPAGPAPRIAAPIAAPILGRLLAAACTLAAFAQPALAAPYGPAAVTPGEKAVAGALDAIPASSTPYNPIRTSLDALPSAAARADALNQLSPRNYRLLPRLAIQAMDASDREIRGYLAQRRDMALDAPAHVPTSGKETITFTAMLGAKQVKYEARADRPHANSDSRSIRAALDITPIDGLIVGATLGIDGIDANLDRRQSPRITQFHVNVGPYASYTNGRYYVDATAGYTLSQAKLRRQISWTNFNDQFVTRGVDGDNTAASVETGAILQLGALRAQPFVGLQYRYADISGFVERGGPAALAVAKFKTQSLRGTIGARATASLRKGDWTIRPEASAQWQRELRSRPDSRIEAIFLAGGGSPIFTLPAARYARNAGLFSAGVSAVHDDRTAFRVGYSGDFARDRTGHAFFISANRRF